MPYVRVSYMTPKDGQEERVDKILDDLSTYYLTCEGYVEGYRLRPHVHDAVRRTGRVGVWASEDAAEAAAQGQHALALRSELLISVDEDTHEELTFEGTHERR
ncbi:MAG: hypothetical protein GEU80_04335 [Dehalococcoidia bacterium]|nr:hypothetical protein [Dehalococcoidia bacterium]